MTIEIIKTQIGQFISSATPEVMAIKGEWGVGKTFSWNKFLKEGAGRKQVSFEKYSYVSLFGVNSLEAFKFSIFENVIDRDLIGTEASIDSFKKNTSSLLKSLGKKSVKFFHESSLLDGFNPAIESLSFLSLNRILICIDDLERKGDDLKLRDILGLISLLKEQKKCKIVILLNEGEEGLEEYKKYKEKVVDLEILFSPTPEECASIAFDSNDEVQNSLSVQTQKLGIKNIRILKKIERLLRLVKPLTENLEPEIEHQVVKSMALYAWCYYSSEGDSSIPPLKYVTKLGYSFSGIGAEKDISEKEKQWKSILQKYGYTLTDELDLVLANVVETGYVVEDEFSHAANLKNQQIIAEKSVDSFHQAWRSYHDSFDNNQDDVIATLHTSFLQNVQNISQINLNGTVTLFRELGNDGLASEIIDHYIKERKENIDLFSLKEKNLYGDVTDSEILTKFRQVYVDSVTVETASEVLARIADKNGWNPDDEVVLANTTADEYYELFKNEKGERLSLYVNRCIRFGQSAGATEQRSQIASRATEALLRIAGESEVNRSRVRMFGVELPEGGVQPDQQVNN